MNPIAPETNSPQNDLTKLRDLVKDIKFAMLTSIGRNGTLHSRPMTTQNDDFHGVLWFFAGLDSPSTEELDAHPQVNVSYAKPGSMEFVSLSGTAKISMDRSKMQQLWSDFYKAWFPQGLDDPNLCLIRIEVGSAEYWDPPSGKVVQLLSLLKALATGEQAHPGGHAHVDLANTADAAAASASNSENSPTTAATERWISDSASPADDLVTKHPPISKVTSA